MKLNEILDSIEKKTNVKLTVSPPGGVCNCLDCESHREKLALVKALRRAINRFTFIQEQEILGASNVAQWAKDDILFLLTKSQDVREGTEAVEHGAPAAAFPNESQDAQQRQEETRD